MGIQTIASQIDAGDGGQRSQIPSLPRQSSLYSLTLSEVQNHLGESFHNMNLEELLKGLDANQELDSPGDQYASSSGLQRQGSFTMPRDLREKTVQELWRDIQEDNNKVIGERRPSHERQLTFGEMTLEDFLAKAGVVPEGSVNDRNNIGGNTNADSVGGEHEYGIGAHWLNQYHQLPNIDHQPNNMMGAYSMSKPMIDGMYSEGQMSMMSSPTTLGAMSDPQTPGRKRGASCEVGVGDKLVERRQKRMIKNRESAARSRARKQAYTNELENKVSRLEEENERLKKQEELDKILYAAAPPEPKLQLRRTTSASF